MLSPQIGNNACKSLKVRQTQNVFMLTHRDFVQRNPCKDESLFLRCNFFVWDILLKDAFSLKTEPILELCAWHLVALEFYNQKKLSVKRPCLKLYSLSEFSLLAFYLYFFKTSLRINLRNHLIYCRPGLHKPKYTTKIPLWTKSDDVQYHTLSSQTTLAVLTHAVRSISSWKILWESLSKDNGKFRG